MISDLVGTIYAYKNRGYMRRCYAKVIITTKAIKLKVGTGGDHTGREQEAVYVMR